MNNAVEIMALLVIGGGFCLLLALLGMACEAIGRVIRGVKRMPDVKIKIKR